MIAGLSRKTMVFLIFIISLSLVGFKLFGKHFETFFPLDEGLVLEYDVTRKKGTEIDDKSKLTVSNLPSRMVEKKTAIPRKYEIKKANNVKSEFLAFFYNDKDGVLFLATQTGKDGQPKPFPTPFYYLKNPLKVGTTWGGGEIPKGFVESVNETVVVPAGTFDNCVKVKLTYPPKMPMNEAVFWFAEKVGIVKSLYKYKNSMEEVFQLTTIKQ